MVENKSTEVKSTLINVCVLYIFHHSKWRQKYTPNLKVASLVCREGLSERNHHFFHIALVAMGLNVRALVRAQLNVGDEQIRDDGLH